MGRLPDGLPLKTRITTKLGPRAGALAGLGRARLGRALTLTFVLAGFRFLQLWVLLRALGAMGTGKSSPCFPFCNWATGYPFRSAALASVNGWAPRAACPWGSKRGGGVGAVSPVRHLEPVAGGLGLNAVRKNINALNFSKLRRDQTPAPGTTADTTKGPTPVTARRRLTPEATTKSPKRRPTCPQIRPRPQMTKPLKTQIQIVRRLATAPAPPVEATASGDQAPPRPSTTGGQPR